MIEEGAAERRTVRLVDVPVGLYREAQQHTDDLLRELVLMAGLETATGVPGTATRLAEAAFRHSEQRAALALVAERVCASAAGERVTIEYDVDLTSAQASEEWAALLDELGALCREGGMLVVPATEEVAAFSRWFCEELVRQLRSGAEPRPWPGAVRA